MIWRQYVRHDRQRKIFFVFRNFSRVVSVRHNMCASIRVATSGYNLISRRVFAHPKRRGEVGFNTKKKLHANYLSTMLRLCVLHDPKGIEITLDTDSKVERDPRTNGTVARGEMTS